MLRGLRLIHAGSGLAQAQLSLPFVSSGNNASTADGGGPMLLNGEIVLCSRDNLTDDRHFSGSLAHLALFDAALTTQQISQLYAAVLVQTDSAPPPTAGAVASTLTPTENAVLSLPLGTSPWLNQFSNSSFLQVRDPVMIVQRRLQLGDLRSPVHAREGNLSHV